jgi:DNA polymerase III epsilon subunit-like protein
LKREKLVPGSQSVAIAAPMVATLNDIKYAVVVLKTTGLFPAKYHCAIEIAIIRMSGDGATADEFTMLVNPGRDVGPTQVHGITARDIPDAPPFAPRPL